MDTATIKLEGDCQTVVLPKGYRLPPPVASVRHEGDAIVLAPPKPEKWPAGFFETIHITDPAFARLPQGGLPPIKVI